MGIILPYFTKLDTTAAILGAILASLASFLAADLVVYPKYGNLAAVLLDAVIATLVVLELGYITGTSFSLAGLGLVAALIAAGEWYYHKYLDRVLFARRRRS